MSRDDERTLPLRPRVQRAHVRDLNGHRREVALEVLGGEDFSVGWSATVDGFGHMLLVRVGDAWKAALVQRHGLLARAAVVVDDNVEVEVLPNRSGEDRLVVVFEGAAA